MNIFFITTGLLLLLKELAVIKKSGVSWSFIAETAYKSCQVFYVFFITTGWL